MSPQNFSQNSEYGEKAGEARRVEEAACRVGQFIGCDDKNGVKLQSRALALQLARANVTLETERTVGRVLAGEEQLSLGHVGFEVLDIRSQDAQEVWLSGENASLERESRRRSPTTGTRPISQATGESPRAVFLCLSIPTPRELQPLSNISQGFLGPLLCMGSVIHELTS